MNETTETVYIIGATGTPHEDREHTFIEVAWAKAMKAIYEKRTPIRIGLCDGA